jgi:predicted GIY-YIG superfamily endonuclease
VSAYLYILRCADGSLYVGTTRDGLEKRIAEHQAGTFGGYTSHRRPVVLVFHQQFQRIEDAISAERQIKGWRREKKEALIRGDYAALPALARRGRAHGWHRLVQAIWIGVVASFETAAVRPPQDKDRS